MFSTFFRKEFAHCRKRWQVNSVSKTICQVGQDKAGLPIGLQFIGRPWSEATLLHIAFAMQARFVQRSNSLPKETVKMQNTSALSLSQIPKKIILT
jgi:hypothetical protein